MLTSLFRWVSDESVTPSPERVYRTLPASSGVDEGPSRFAPTAIPPSFLS